MADELKQSQLARIVVPAITDVNYAEGMADAFDKINDNFKKIASLPFLQGVQGDSYQLEEYKIWNDDWTITEDGKVLLNSIFGKDVTTISNSFDDIRESIGQFMPEENGVSPIDFFKNGNDIVNNTLYFYVIKDDTGNVIEKQLGQFYYFIDERLKKIGDSYNNENISSTLDTFNDYTGFYQYKYDTKLNDGKYIRLEILPSIYYDKNKNDICWKFNGIETGISAIGVKGSDGKDADLLIVRVSANENDYTGVVNAIINPNAENYSTEQWITDLSDLKEGKALICIQNKNKEPQDFAYGQVINTGGDYKAYWEPNYNFSKLIGDNRITNYFYNMGEDETATAPFYLAIPSYNNRGPSGDPTEKQKAHIISGKNKDDGTERLRVFHSDKAFDENGNQRNDPQPSSLDARTLNIENYNVEITNGLSVGRGVYISGSLGVNDGDLTISDDARIGGILTVNDDLYVMDDVLISGSLGVANRIDVGNGGVNSYTEKDGALVVSGGIGITLSANIGKNLTVGNKLTVKGTSGAVSYDNADVTIYGGVGIAKSVIVGSSGKMFINNVDEVQNTGTGALNVKGDIYTDKNIIAKNKSESSYSVLTGINDDLTAIGSSGLKPLVEAYSEGTIFSGGGPNISSIGSGGINRTVYNRTALQSYHTDSSKKYTSQEYHINPCGGQVFINKYIGGPSNALSASNALVVDGGLYARTKKPKTVVDKGTANGLSNVLIGHNDPGNGTFNDFPNDLDKGGYPLVIKSLESDGTETKGAIVIGTGDIYALSGDTSTGWSAGTLCLNHRNGYRGDVQIGKDLNVGDSTVGGNATIHSTSSSNGKLTVEGTATITGLTTMNSGATITGLTTINSGGLKVKADGATITGLTTMNSGATITGNTTINSGNIEITTSGNQIILPTTGVSWKDTNNLVNSAIHIKGPTSTSTSFHSLIGTNSKSNNIVNIGVVNDAFGIYGIINGSTPTSGPDWKCIVDTNTGDVTIDSDLTANNISANNVSATSINIDTEISDSIVTNTITTSSIDADKINGNVVDCKDITSDKITSDDIIFNESIRSEGKNIVIKDVKHDLIKNAIDDIWVSRTVNNDSSASLSKSGSGYSGTSKTRIIRNWASKSTSVDIYCPAVTYTCGVDVKNNNTIYKIEGIDLTLKIKIYLYNETKKSIAHTLYEQSKKIENNSDVYAGKKVRYSWTYSSTTVSKSSLSVNKGDKYSLMIDCLAVGNWEVDNKGTKTPSFSNESYLFNSSNNNFKLTQNYTSESYGFETYVCRNAVITGYKPTQCSGIFTESDGTVKLFATKEDSGLKCKSIAVKDILDKIGSSWTSL